MSQDVLRVLHYSTHNEDCGIGKYQEMFINAMEETDNLKNSFYPVSPNKSKLMTKSQLNDMLSDLSNVVQDYDILHIQHEFSFYRDNEMGLIIDAAAKQGKKTIVTVHTSPNIIDTNLVLKGLGPRSWVALLKKYSRKRWLLRSMINPLKKADIVIVHNEVTKKALTKFGIEEARIRKMIIPVPKVSQALKSKTIKEALKAEKGDIILSTVGFLHRYKGLKEAIKSLSYLPPKYKLAIIGGLHPHTDDIKIYDQLTDQVRDLGLIDRVYITGYIKDDDEMNALIRETDVCLYPYDKDYYSNVSSAALNNSFANHVPAVVYPTKSFVEIDNEYDSLNVVDTYSYYEMARVVTRLDLVKAQEVARNFADTCSYPNVSKKLIAIYTE